MTDDFAAPAAPRGLGPAPATGRIRTTPDDFRVDEMLGFEPDGTGGHALLTVEKRDANTGWVAAQLARQAGVGVRDVGFSGHKDRHAVTRQAFSLPVTHGFDVAECLAWAGEGYRVVGAHRHGRKLRPGSHRGNRFELRIRSLAGPREAIERRLDAIRALGVPNYFGPQRFGNDGANLRRAADWAAGTFAPRDRAQRGFTLSAARSLLFNEVLAARVHRGDWDRLLPGEAVMLDGRRSWFAAASIDATLVARCEAMDVHPSGPLPGRGEPPVSDVVLALETDVLQSRAALVELLQREGLEHERRSLRLPVRELEWSFPAPDELALAFVLPRGTFATAVLHELLEDAWQAGEGAEE
jgi:tRNA pseudouridine13 synthase